MTHSHDTPGPGRTLRRAGALVAQRGVDLLLVGVAAVLVARLLGPADFGRLNVLNAAVRFFALVSGLGSVQVMGRFVPALRLAGDERGIARLFAGLLALRSVSGMASALACYAALRLWLDDLPALLLGMTAATVALRTLANLPFALFLGLDRPDRWGLGELLRAGLLLLIGVPACAQLGLPGAVSAPVLIELMVLGAGLVLGRAFLRGDARPSLAQMAPYLRYNALFFAGNLLSAAAQHGTGPLIRALGAGYGEVAYFAAGHAVYLMAAGVWSQLSTSFAPLYSWLRAHGEEVRMVELAERLLRGLAVVCCVATLVALLLGRELVVLVLGAAFAPAASVLPVLALAVLAAGAGHVARTLASTWDRPDVAWQAAAVEALGLALLAAPLLPRFGALGGAVALLTAMVASNAVWWLRLRALAPGYLSGLGRALGCAAPFLAAALLGAGASLPARLALLLGCAAGYATLLARTRLVTPHELRALVRALRAREVTLAAPAARE